MGFAESSSFYLYMFFLCIMILYYRYISNLYRNYVQNDIKIILSSYTLRLYAKCVYVCSPCLSVRNFVDMAIDKIIDSIKMFYVYLYFQQ